MLYWLWHKVDQAKWIAPFSTTIFFTVHVAQSWSSKIICPLFHYNIFSWDGQKNILELILYLTLRQYMHFCSPHLSHRAWPTREKNHYEVRCTKQYTGAYPMSHAQAVYNFDHPLIVSFSHGTRPTWEKVKPMVEERTGAFTGLACRTFKRCCTKFCPPKLLPQTKPRVLGWVKPMVKNHTQDFGLS